MKVISCFMFLSEIRSWYGDEAGDISPALPPFYSDLKTASFPNHFL